MAITQACHDEAAERFRGYSIEALEEEWQKAVQRRGEMPRNPDKAFLAWAAVYANNHPLPWNDGPGQPELQRGRGWAEQQPLDEI